MKIVIPTEQVMIVRKTWKMLRLIDPVIIGDVFYSKLFAGNASFRRMFPANMNDQYRKLVITLNKLIGKLDNTSEIENELISLARQHADFGLRAVHYKPAGEALSWTIRQGLGKDWSPQVDDAWINCYTRLTGFMNAVALSET